MLPDNFDPMTQACRCMQCGRVTPAFKDLAGVGKAADVLTAEHLRAVKAMADHQAHAHYAEYEVV